MQTFTAWDPVKGRIAWSEAREILHLVGRTLGRWRPGVLRNARGLPQSDRSHDRKRALEVQDSVRRIVGNVFTYEHGGKQFVGAYSGVGGWARN